MQNVKFLIFLGTIFVASCGALPAQATDNAPDRTHYSENL